MIKVAIQKDLLGAEKEIKLDVNFSIKSGEFVALSGDSGSGKTTILRILAGLEDASGSIEIFDKKWLDRGIFVPPQKREIGFVFQNYALFLNMTIEENLLYVSKDIELAKHLLNITNLYSLRSRYPKQLSGGQQQRVAVARALMKRPKLLLLDEPLSALDKKIRESLQDEILSLHKEFGTTTILVSHDKEEIEKLCTRELLLKDGKITSNNIIKTHQKAKVIKRENGKIVLEVEDDIFKDGDIVNLQLHS